MRILDLFCGAGGAAEGYARAGFEVVGVDITPQPNYPFRFYHFNALDILKEREFVESFDAIHASPPCQFHSTVTPQGSRKEHLNLIPPTRDLLLQYGKPYVIENVMGAKSSLVDPIQLCGSSFGLDVRRHRLFEVNWNLQPAPCDHSWQTPRFDVYEHGKWIKSPVVRVYGTGGGKAAEHWEKAMGIDWMTRKELAQAIPPAYTEFIGQQLMEYLCAQ
jgi:SAM-dependent methyltransferase